MSKISDLSDGGSLQSTDFLVAVRSGGNVKVQADDLTLDTLTVEGTLRVPNNEKLIFGTSSTELEVYYSSGPDVVLMDSPSAPLQLGASQVNIASYGGTNYAVFDSTGVDVTGTVTADGATIDGDIAISGSQPRLAFQETDTTDLDVYLRVNTGNFTIETRTDAGVKVGDRIRAASNGDISFYEDTGTTAKFFWDASAESLGINDTSPSRRLSVNSGGTQIAARFESTSTTSARIGLVDGNTTADNYVNVAAVGDAMALYAGAAERFRITSGGNVGIGTTSPASLLELSGAKNTSELRLSSTTNNSSWVVGDYYGKLSFYSGDGSGGGAGVKASVSLINALGTTGSTSALVFSSPSTTANDVERMRLDASGNLLVGKSSADDGATAGTEIQSDAQIYVTKTGGNTLFLNRLNTDGDIARFSKDGTTVGSIGSFSGSKVYIGSPSSAGALFATNGVMPVTDGSLADNAHDLGQSSARFKDLYLSGGVYLGGTGAANKLDDYEEGTFTASLRGTSEPATLLTSSSTYRKIGATVHFCIAFELVTTTGYSGNVEITGLPFAHITGRRSVVNIALFNDGVWSSGEQLVGIVTSGATNVQFYRLRSADTWQRVQFHTAGSSRYFWATGTYTTTS